MALNEIQLKAKSSYGSSDLESRISSIASIVPKITKKPNTELFKMQRICKVCRLNLKESAIKMKNKKYRCKFCYEAVCENCSSFKVFHVVLGKNERICIACFNQTIEEKLRDEEQKVKDVVVELAEGEKKTDLVRIEQLKLRLERGKKEKLLKSEELKELCEKCDELMGFTASGSIVVVSEKHDTKSLQKILMGKNDEFNKIKDSTMVGKRELCELNVNIIKSEAKINELVIEREKMKKKNLNLIKEKKNNSQTQRVGLVVDQIFSYRGIISTTEHDISNLKNKLEKLKKAESCQLF